MLHSILGILFLIATGMVDAAEKEITIGTVENVILLPWGVKLPARIDTGAAKSSLDARELTIRNNMAEFKLPVGYGDTRLRLPVIEWRHVRTTEGLKRRPVVSLVFCLGPKRIRTKVALDDRTGLEYPLLVGRNTLRGKFVVDVKRRNIAPPSCSLPSP